MTIIECTFEDICSKIGPLDLILNETHYFDSIIGESGIPPEFDDLQKRVIAAGLHIDSYGASPFPWKLMKYVDGQRDLMEDTEMEYVQTIMEALSNAVVRGNKKDITKPLQVRVYQGEPPISLTQIEDDGDGYDWRRVNDENIKSNWGVGFECYLRESVIVFFERECRLVNIAPSHVV